MQMDFVSDGGPGLTYGFGKLVIDIDESTITTQDSSGTKAKMEQIRQNTNATTLSFLLLGGAFQSG